MKTIIHPGNLQCFLEVYEESLKEARLKHPNDYQWPDSEFEKVMDRMRTSIERGTFNKDSHAFKITCKKLNIKHTYTAIREFISLQKEDYMKTLKQLRIQSGVSQDTLAVMVGGKWRNSISVLENNLVSPSVHTLRIEIEKDGVREPLDLESLMGKRDQ